MENFKAYLSIIDSRFLCFFNGKHKYLIELVQKGDKSEKEIEKVICGTIYKHSYYKNLKSKTLSLLQMFTIESSLKTKSLVKKKFDLCQKKIAVGHKLLGKGGREEGIRLLRQAYLIAVEYDFTHLACELSSVLYHDQVYYHPNLRKANYYAAQVDKHLQAYTNEKKAEHLYYQVIANKHRSKHVERLEETIRKMERLKMYSLKCEMYRCSLKVMHGFITGNYLSIVKNCNKTLHFFKNKKGVYTSYHQYFLSKLGVAYMAVYKYKEASENFAKAEKYAPRKSFNDYLLRLYKTINALHAGEYQFAYDLYQQNKRCRFEPIREQFAIIEAYLCFLSQMGYLQLKKNFRLGKYLNETFKAQADKQGDNIAILIAELLVLLVRDRGKFIDRVEATKNYSYRHLRGKDTMRAKRLIKILCILPRANFHPIAIKRLAQRHFDFLKTHPIQIGENVTIIELLPFGDLLDMILAQLERKVA